MSTFPEYDQYDALGLAELVRNKQVSASELVEAAIERIERRNPALNAVIHKMYEKARAAAQAPLPDGPFTGVPFLVKDLVSPLAGEPLTAASRSLRNYVPNYDSELMRRYKATGVVIVGKTNSPEFGLTPYTEPELFGPTRNPWNPERISGGSSGGSGAAVGARMVPMASGGDGGGSIRIPAACCGIVGLKPTRARTPMGPDVAESWHGFVVEHVLTRSVRDCALMLDAVQGPDAGAAYYPPPPVRPYLQEVTTAPGKLRIAITSHPFQGKQVHADCKQGLAETAKLLESLGHTVVEAKPEIDGERFNLAFFTMLLGEVNADIENTQKLTGRKPRKEEFEIATWVLGMLGKHVTAGQYVAAVHFLQNEARKVSRFLEQYDLLVTPTLSAPPAVVGSLQPKPIEKKLLAGFATARAGWLLSALNMAPKLAQDVFAYIPYTALFNVSGHPAISLPLYWNAEGLPIGMQFVGRYADEATLFRLAGQLEQAKPWAGKVPSMASV